MRKAVTLLLIGLLLAGAACTRPKPRGAEKEATPQVEKAVPAVQPTPGQTVISVQETLTPTLTPILAPTSTPEIAMIPLPTATPSPTAEPTQITAGEQASPQIGVQTTHIVQRGENLYRIGLKYGVSAEAIAQINGIANPNLIFVGQRLTIPTGEASISPTGGRIHIVQRGENLYRIGLRYGVSVQAIAQANGIINPNQIFVGQKLIIP